MPKVFKVSPKRKTNVNGVVLSQICPFNNGGKEVQEAYMRVHGVDIKKACASKSHLCHAWLKKLFFRKFSCCSSLNSTAMSWIIFCIISCIFENYCIFAFESYLITNSRGI